jgi:hypothetical protein
VGPARKRARRVPPAPLDLGATAIAKIISIAVDLMLASRVDGMLTAAGHEVTLARSLQEAPLQGAELIVADLEVENPEALVGLGVPVLGYYSHVDVETKEVADAAGIDLAVPRSRMARELPALVEKLLSE